MINEDYELEESVESFSFHLISNELERHFLLFAHSHEHFSNKKLETTPTNLKK